MGEGPGLDSYIGRCQSLPGLKMCVLLDSAIPFLGIYLGDMLACVVKMCAEESPGSFVWNSKMLATAWCPPVGAWLNQLE